MLASFEAEQSDRRVLRVALTDGWRAETVVRAVVRGSATWQGELRLRVGGGTVQAARLVATEADATDTPAGSGAALITGGLGGLGLSSAAVLAEAGYSAITLMGRSEPDARARAAIGELTERGVRVTVVRGDVTVAADCRDAVARAGADVPLRAVLHLAGATADRSFDQLGPADFATAFAAKAGGAVQLAAALADTELDALVLFSSASAVLGSAGQANYAAANGFLAGLARRLRAAGVPVTCVDWGPWIPQRGGGLADAAAARAAAARAGLRPLSDAEAGDLLRVALGGDPQRLLAVALDPERYPEWTAGSLVRPPTAGAVPAPPVRERGALRGTLAALPAEAREERLREELRELLAATVGGDAVIDDDRGFAEAGLDSIMVIDLRTKLSEAIARDLPATVALDHPTVARLAAHTLDLLFRAAEAEAEDEAPATGPAQAPAAEPVPPPAPAPERGTGEPGGEKADEADQEADQELAAMSFDELLQAVQADVSTEK
jgi:NAD(P)-dependent dehydrogenase (short-subunit alcohol dehydrogenase family)/acyl carrier protein